MASEGEGDPARTWSRHPAFGHRRSDMASAFGHGVGIRTWRRHLDFDIGIRTWPRHSDSMPRLWGGGVGAICPVTDKLHLLLCVGLLLQTLTGVVALKLTW